MGPVEGFGVWGRSPIEAGSIHPSIPRFSVRGFHEGIQELASSTVPNMGEIGIGTRLTMGTPTDIHLNIMEGGNFDS